MFFIQVGLEKVGCPDRRLFSIYDLRPAFFCFARFGLIMSLLILLYRLDNFSIRESNVGFITRAR